MQRFRLNVLPFLFCSGLLDLLSRSIYALPRRPHVLRRSTLAPALPAGDRGRRPWRPRREPAPAVSWAQSPPPPLLRPLLHRSTFRATRLPRCAHPSQRLADGYGRCPWSPAAPVVAHRAAAGRPCRPSPPIPPPPLAAAGALGGRGLRRRCRPTAGREQGAGPAGDRQGAPRRRWGRRAPPPPAGRGPRALPARRGRRHRGRGRRGAARAAAPQPGPLRALPLGAVGRAPGRGRGGSGVRRGAPGPPRREARLPCAGAGLRAGELRARAGAAGRGAAAEGRVQGGVVGGSREGGRAAWPEGPRERPAVVGVCWRGAPCGGRALGGCEELPAISFSLL
ncbi:translation initiation factor IF-2-like [Falco peregrinus]|uniref:translation initiation factor IF-2-like n=1 Tax=Falco peregrinus TaxID=8954 RepID=UPI00247B0AB0|nr:translation initiation factor IF-2-like [Falco peregrinus]